MSELNDKQKMFCLEYLKDLNGTQAAIRAGYSKNTANEQASRMLTNVNIQEFLTKLMEDKKNSLIAEQDEVLETLTRILRREETDTVVVTLKSHKTHYDDEGKKVVEDEEKPVAVPIPTRVGDVNKAAELLGKRYGLFIEKIQGNITTKNQDDLNRYMESIKNGELTNSKEKG